MKLPEPQKEHRWLQRLVGEWKYENEYRMGPDQPPGKGSGSESVRSLGGLWTISEGTGEMQEGGEFKSIMTLGFDPEAKRFVGTFVASMMTYLWPYNGSLDSEEKVLTLDSEGPSFSGDGSMAKYQDIIEFVSEDHRIMSSQFLGPDGMWIMFMTTHYHRVSS